MVLLLERGWNQHAITSYKSSEQQGSATLGEVSYCISLAHRMFLILLSLPITLLHYELTLRHTQVGRSVCLNIIKQRTPYKRTTVGIYILFFPIFLH